MDNIDQLREKVIELNSKIQQLIIVSSGENITYSERMLNQFYFNKYLNEYYEYRFELRTRLVNDINNNKVLKLEKNKK